MTEHHARPEPNIDMTQDFRWGEVPSDHREGLVPDTTPPDPPLGPIAAFTGMFQGNGFNTIFRPQNIGLSPTQLDNPPHGPSDNVLELNLTEETLEFSSPLGRIPNRGFAQADVFLNGIPYIQKVKDVNDPNNKVDIHFEPGVWLNIPDTNPATEGPLVARMASIPHGTTVDAEGTAKTTPGGPGIDPVDITPFPIGQPGNRLVNTFPSQKANDDHTFRLPQDLKPFVTAKTITQAMLDNPNIVLQNRAQQQNITSTTTITIDTTRPANGTDPLFGGGTANIGFLLGDKNAANPNANTVDMSATFWIETVTEQITVPPMAANQTATVSGDASAGEPVAQFTVTAATDVIAPIQVDVTYTQIQYSQLVLLNFAALSWPHVSVATLIPASIPVTVPVPGGPLLTTYIVVAGDTLSGISQHFYGDTGHVAMLAAINKIADPNVIQVGQLLIIPQLSHTHTVVAGDTLSGISQAAYGDTGHVAMLAAVNRIADPNVVQVGQVLVVPDLSHTHTVVGGDTLFGIAQQSYGHGSLFGFIAEVDGIADPNTLNTGQVLVIPSV
ncbi:MAG TPA: heme-binding protein [Mycobacterium sp.]|nr:heme-binding protein [Mycobacterium sp.]